MQKDYLLSFETSCDETSVAVIKDAKVISNVFYTQKIHEEYGGVVPEIASRAHMEKIVPVYLQALKEAQIDIEDIGVIAYTQAPGLIGALLVGATFAKTLAQSRNLPLIDVHHIEAHAIANGIEHPDLNFPLLCLIVSGGHTEFRICHSYTHTEVIGRTIDDAAGEAFDKIAKLMNLPYPGGPMIDQLAKNGDPTAFKFAKSTVPGLDFSFSGVKTSVMYFLDKSIEKDPDFLTRYQNDLAASAQETIVSMLLDKYRKAILQTGIKDISVAGGVSANSYLREKFTELAAELNVRSYIPAMQYCTDNAGMIGYAAYHKWKAGIYSHNYNTVPSSR